MLKLRHLTDREFNALRSNPEAFTLGLRFAERAARGARDRTREAAADAIAAVLKEAQEYAPSVRSLDQHVAASR
ncbi:MAG: hypothetical protein K2X76_05065 [Sphingomonas sp.]|nr:hypothetical protein [Sphingomonas sp.]